MTAAAPGGRPLRADARRNRERVLAAAREAFAAEGLAVPLDDIAARAGVGPGTVYRHFPTKEALFAAVVRDRVDRLAADGRDLASADDAGAAFFGFLARLADEGRAKRDMSDALGGAEPVLDVAAARDAMQEALGVLLARAQQAGAARTDVTVADLMALLKGTLVAVQAAPDPATADRLLAVVSDGLRPPRSP